MTILEALRDRNLFAPWFRDPTTWAAWHAFLCALFALPMTPEQLTAYQRCTGRSEPPASPATEGWLVCGRRAGKSFVLALVAVFLAAFHEYRRYLAPGEMGTILIIAGDRRQARVILRFIRGLLLQVPMLKAMVERETSDAFDLTNGVSIEVATASFRSVRGYTIIAALCDEIARWPTDDAAEPDYAILDAIRPGMVTIPNAMLLCASSPYAQRGAMWDAHRNHFGRDGDPVLVWQAPTRDMNPTVAQRIVDEALQRDRAWAEAEYLGQFRADLESYITRGVLEKIVGPYDTLEPLFGCRYHAFTDVAGGAGTDGFAIAVGHKDAESGALVVDHVTETMPPFSPEEVVRRYAALLGRYGMSSVMGDRYAGQWVAERFRQRGVRYFHSPRVKADLYIDLLPQLYSGAIVLPKHAKLLAQLCGLERRTGRGKDLIDHAPSGHDDLANVVAGVAYAMANGPPVAAVGHY